MAWRIEYDISVRKSVEKLDRQTRQRIHDFLQNRVAKLDDPRQNGKALKGSTLGSFWRYRVGDYRIICDIQDRKLVVLVIEIGHRRDVYR
jgi:mRNA interferase RelE/StbE